MSAMKVLFGHLSVGYIHCLANYQSLTLSNAWDLVYRTTSTANAIEAIHHYDLAIFL